jgi:hypothetical protein
VTRRADRSGAIGSEDPLEGLVDHDHPVAVVNDDEWLVVDINELLELDWYLQHRYPLVPFAPSVFVFLGA